MENIIAKLEKSCLEIYQIMGKVIPSKFKVESENLSGDIQKPLDIITNQIIINNLSTLPEIAGLLSEENDDYLEINKDGKYIVSFDPLDGSGNSVLNLSTGSIFAIFSASKLEEISGRKIIGAVYSIYGATLEIIKVTDQLKTRTVYVTKNNQLQPVIINDNLTIPEKGNIYVANEGNFHRWTPKIQTYINSLRGRSLRWMACFVADVHRLLLEGGMYMYPSDTKQTQGKLRLLYEVYPMAYIWEKCGGISQDETGNSCLDIPFIVDNIHQRTPILLFGKYEFQCWLKLK